MPMMTQVDAPFGPAIAPGRIEIRLARLKPEYSILYPALKPGLWEPAVTVADRLLADGVLHGHVTALWGRTLTQAHFDFRGGSSRGGERVGMREEKRQRVRTT